MSHRPHLPTIPRRLRSTAAVALFTGVLAAVHALPAAACSCTPPGAPEEELEHSAAVFIGKVLSVEPVGDELEGPAAQFARLRVTVGIGEVVKGLGGAAQTERDTVVLTTAASSAACGYPFEDDCRYLIYAHGGDDGDELTVSLCSRTRRLEDAGEDLVAFGVEATVP